MNILCPGCHSSVYVDDITLKLVCMNCGLESDLSGIGTFSGTVSSPVVRDLTGDTIGDFSVMELIGLGGMGVVYKACNRHTGTIVALKVLNHDLNEAAFVQRFRREAKTLEKLDHPNIVSVFGSGSHESIYYIVTEYLEGETLAEYIRKKPPEFPETVSIMQEICSAVSHAHLSGVIHRDLKPANIMITPDGIKVLDFGLARITGGDTQSFSLTRTDIAMGTLNYLSPEQRLNAKAIDGRSDIFSLGVILYELLTGTLPIGRYDPPEKHNRTIPKAVNTIIDKCLAPDVQNRFHSVDAFSDALARLNRPAVSISRIATAIILTGLAMFLIDTPETDFKATIIRPVSTSVKTDTAVQKPDLSRIPVPETLPHEMDHFPDIKTSPKKKRSFKKAAPFSPKQ